MSDLQASNFLDSMLPTDLRDLDVEVYDTYNPSAPIVSVLACVHTALPAMRLNIPRVLQLLFSSVPGLPGNTSDVNSIAYQPTPIPYETDLVTSFNATYFGNMHWKLVMKATDTLVDNFTFARACVPVFLCLAAQLLFARVPAR